MGGTEDSGNDRTKVVASYLIPAILRVNQKSDSFDSVDPDQISRAAMIPDKSVWSWRNGRRDMYGRPICRICIALARRLARLRTQENCLCRATIKLRGSSARRRSRKTLMSEVARRRRASCELRIDQRHALP